MKNLKDLADYIKRNKRYNCGLFCSIDGFTVPLNDAFYLADKKEYWFLADSDSVAISTDSILSDAYKYPVIELVVGSEETGCIKSVKGFHTEYGIESFGERNLVILDC